MPGRTNARLRLRTERGVRVKDQLRQQPDLIDRLWHWGGRDVLASELKRKAAKTGQTREKILAIGKLVRDSKSQDLALKAVAPLLGDAPSAGSAPRRKKKGKPAASPPPAASAATPAPGPEPARKRPPQAAPAPAPAAPPATPSRRDDIAERARRTATGNQREMPLVSEVLPPSPAGAKRPKGSMPF